MGSEKVNKWLFDLEDLYNDGFIKKIVGPNR